jgi:hypothetical protein
VNKLNEEIRYYKGKHRVKILTRTQGSWIVEALEPFEDTVNGQEVQVKTRERRIVSPNLLYKKPGLAPTVKEHTYELKMEEKLKNLVEEEEKKKTRKAEP